MSRAPLSSNGFVHRGKLTAFIAAPIAICMCHNAKKTDSNHCCVLEARADFVSNAFSKLQFMDAAHEKLTLVMIPGGNRPI
jgi:hypothetical protein